MTRKRQNKKRRKTGCHSDLSDDISNDGSTTPQSYTTRGKTHHGGSLLNAECFKSLSPPGTGHQSSVNQAPVSQSPVNQSSVSQSPVNQALGSFSLVNQAPVNQSPVIQSPVMKLFPSDPQISSASKIVLLPLEPASLEPDFSQMSDPSIILETPSNTWVSDDRHTSSRHSRDLPENKHKTKKRRRHRSSSSSFSSRSSSDSHKRDKRSKR